MIFLAYFVHKFSHINKNIFSILHHYHHENNNFFSHFSQILLELSLGIIIVPCYYINNMYLGENYLDVWTAALFTLFYSTVHNFNYGQLRVNDVHYLHHKNMFTNIGPDICDIAFGTKHPDNTEVENTNHYIPNILFFSIIILFIKYLCNDTNIQTNILKLLGVMSILSILFIVISSIYLYQYY